MYYYSTYYILTYFMLYCYTIYTKLQMSKKLHTKPVVQHIQVQQVVSNITTEYLAGSPFLGKLLELVIILIRVLKYYATYIHFII